MVLHITHNYGNALLHAKRLVNGLTNPDVTECYRNKYARIHLVDCIKCPTIGRLARHNAFKGVDTQNDFYRDKALILDNNPEIVKLRLDLRARLRQTQKTQVARNFIINNDRIAFGKVKKTKHNFRRFIFKYLGI